MGSPKLAKTVLWLAILVGGAISGMKYINAHPHAADLNRVQPQVNQPQGGQGGGHIVVIP